VDTLREISDEIKVIAAAGYNTRIISRNTRRQAPQPYAPLKKTVSTECPIEARICYLLQIPRSGLQLAQALVPPNIRPLVPPAMIATVGALPRDFNPDLGNYQNIQILNHIIFYNDDFGIVVGDPLSARIEKFCGFLAEF
jgi:hypothetical protein